MKNNSHWLADPAKETIGILLPLFIPVVVVFFFNDYFSSQTEVTTLWWLVLVLMIDVGHVYSTLFRFYWEKNTFAQYKSLLIIIPVASLIVGVGIHMIDSFLFWRILAYAALFHFIRQQYGFMRLYSKEQGQPAWASWLDSFSIYNATLYPVVFWHLHLTDSLSWFIPNDFISISLPADGLIFTIYIIILITYVIKEVYYSLQSSDFNWPKNGIVMGTYLSWYAGIIFFKGDLAFTLMNVVSHGIPYMVLIWLYGSKKNSSGFSFGWKGVFIFFIVLFGLAYFEESLWDILVWKDHSDLFPFFEFSNPLSNPWVLSVVVPLLTLPQITHYVLDGFIWRLSKDRNARIS